MRRDRWTGAGDPKRQAISAESASPSRLPSRSTYHQTASTIRRSDSIAYNDGINHTAMTPASANAVGANTNVAGQMASTQRRNGGTASPVAQATAVRSGMAICRSHGRRGSADAEE
jgi:hypothetical protein